MAITVDLSCAWGPLAEGSTAGGIACRNTAFPYSGKPRTAANGVGPTGVQGLSPGTPFFPSGKKGSVYPFSVPLFLEGADHG